MTTPIAGSAQMKRYIVEVTDEVHIAKYDDWISLWGGSIRDRFDGVIRNPDNAQLNEYICHVRELPSISDEELGRLARDTVLRDDYEGIQDIGAAVRKALLGEPA